MKVIRSPEVFRKVMTQERLKGRTLGFVPTMGALHQGHLSLVRAARRENDRVAVSIFVNPLQFGPSEDFKRYPRPGASDRKLLEREKVSYLFLPSPRAIYPAGFQTTVEPGPMAKVLCGRFRPGHFRGVTTVVARLFLLAMPDRAYFGAKDFQQAKILERMVLDLGFNLKMRMMPIVREADGLAMSSRNAYLTAEERRRALGFSQALALAKRRMSGGEQDLAVLKRFLVSYLVRQGIQVQYVEWADPETLEPLKASRPRMLLALAGYVGKTRLIDNVIITAFRGRKK